MTVKQTERLFALQEVLIQQARIGIWTDAKRYANELKTIRLEREWSEYEYRLWNILVSLKKYKTNFNNKLGVKNENK